MMRRLKSEVPKNQELPPLFLTSFSPTPEEHVLGFYSLSITKRNKSTDIPPNIRHYGRYPIRQVGNGPLMQFSRSPRFQDNYLDGEIRVILSKHRKSNNSYIVDSNKANVGEYRQVRQKRLEALITNTSQRMYLSQKRKMQMYNDSKRHLVFSLKEKQRKFELRLRKEEAIQVKKAWLCLYLSVGAIFVTKRVIENRHLLKQRTQKSMRILVQVTRCVGKIRIKLKEIRHKRSVRILKIYLLVKVKNWIKQRRRFYASLVTFVFERSLTSDTLFRLMADWHYKAILITRTMKEQIVSKRLMYNNLLDKWAAMEAALNSELQVKKSKKKKTLSRKKDINSTSIPEEIKIHYLKTVLYKNIKQYIQKLREYRNYKKKERAELKSKREKKKPKAQKSNVKVSRPLKPNIEDIFTRELIEKLISKAQRQRTFWPQILERQKELFDKAISN